MSKEEKKPKSIKKKKALSKERETFVEFFWELVSCWLLTMGICFLMDAQFPMQAGLGAIAWHTALTIALTALFTRRVGLFIIVLEASAVGGILWLWQAENAEKQLLEAVDFLQWWLDNLPQDSPWYTPHSMSIVHTVMHIGIGLLLFTLMRTTRRTWPLLTLCFGVAVYVMAWGDTTNSPVAVAAFLAGSFPLLSRDHYRGRRLFSRKNKFSPLGGRWIAATASGMLCLSVTCGLLYALPADTTNFRTRWCSVVTADVQSVVGWYTAAQQQVPTQELSDFGLQAYYRVGGDLSLPPSEVLASFEDTSPRLVRVTSYDTFDGDCWTNSFATSYRPESFWPIREREALSASVMENDGRSLLESIAPTRDVTITLHKKSNYLPTMGYIDDITEHTSTKSPLQFNRHGQLFSYFTLPEGYTYTLRCLTLPTDRSLTAQELEILGSCSLGQDELTADEEFVRYYTALPENFSSQAKELASERTEDVFSQYEKAYRLSRSFSTNLGYTYTDTPGGFYAEENIVDKLLKSKRGHCAYYATAMAGMARSVGIPARLAVGYRTQESEKEGVYVVDAASPYAWVECYITNMGWVAFDPTPRKEEAVAPSPEIIPSVGEAPDFESRPEENEGEAEGKPDDNATYEESLPQPQLSRFTLPKGFYWWLLLLVAVLGLTAHGVWIPRAYAYAFVSKRFVSPRQQTVFYYRAVLRQLAARGFALQEGEALGELLQRVELGREETTAAVRQALQPVQAMLYGDETPTPQQVQDLAALWQQLDKEARESLSPPMYILQCRLLMPYFCPYPSCKKDKENVCE